MEIRNPNRSEVVKKFLLTHSMRGVDIASHGILKCLCKFIYYLQVC